MRFFVLLFVAAAGTTWDPRNWFSRKKEPVNSVVETFEKSQDWNFRGIPELQTIVAKSFGVDAFVLTEIQARSEGILLELSRLLGQLQILQSTKGSVDPVLALELVGIYELAVSSSKDGMAKAGSLLIHMNEKIKAATSGNFLSNFANKFAEGQEVWTKFYADMREIYAKNDYAFKEFVPLLKAQTQLITLVFHYGIANIGKEAANIAPLVKMRKLLLEITKDEVRWEHAVEINLLLRNFFQTMVNMNKDWKFDETESKHIQDCLNSGFEDFIGRNKSVDEPNSSVKTCQQQPSVDTKTGGGRKRILDEAETGQKGDSHSRTKRVRRVSSDVVAPDDSGNLQVVPYQGSGGQRSREFSLANPLPRAIGPIPINPDIQGPSSTTHYKGIPLENLQLVPYSTEGIHRMFTPPDVLHSGQRLALVDDVVPTDDHSVLEVDEEDDSTDEDDEARRHFQLGPSQKEQPEEQDDHPANQHDDQKWYLGKRVVDGISGLWW